MNQRNYGDRFKEHLLEQYKLYVEMADRISARRGQTNKFYISLLSALLALISITVSRNLLDSFQIIIFFTIGILGLLLSILWSVNIRSYRQLNSGKFKVIHEMEQYLPFNCYDREWEILGRGKDARKYFQLTRIEQYIPFILGIPYLILFIYSLYILIKYICQK